MDRITVRELDEWQRAGRCFSLIDVRRAAVRAADAAAVPGARWHDPQQLFAWKDEVARDRPAIVYCAKGHEIGQGVAATLRALGLDARYLVDGFVGWKDAGLALVALTAQEVLP